jgi:hypothetical protein
MINPIPLTSACLKGFLRNKKQILLLIVFPLLLISSLFFSFSPEGLQKTPVGLVQNSDSFNFTDYEADYFPYLEVTEYAGLDECLEDLKEYKLYLCIETNYAHTHIINLYFDNTREPIIWQIIQKIKGSVNLIQNEKSAELAGQIIGDIGSKSDHLEAYQSSIREAQRDIDSYIFALDRYISSLRSARKELSDTKASMDIMVSEIKSAKKTFQNEESALYSSVISRLDNTQKSISAIENASPENLAVLSMVSSEISATKQAMVEHQSLSNNYLNTFDSKIGEYEKASREWDIILSELDREISNLENTRRSLILHKETLRRAESDLELVRKDLNLIKSIDPENLVNPINLLNYPTYIPESSGILDEKKEMDKEDKIKAAIQGLNFISLQTLFPTILILITLFLSLLVSSFICLNEINSPANKRIKLIKNIFISEVLSIYISSLLIISVPVTCVILAGQYLFQLSIFPNLGAIIPLLLLLSSIFILMGLALALTIKKESWTLMLNTFLLIFFIIFSGFILPVERMNEASALLASNSPGKIALNAFNKAVFYSQPAGTLVNDFLTLSFWLFLMLILVIAAKRYRA